MGLVNKMWKSMAIKKEVLILVCITILVFLVHIMYIREIGIFSILDDEFGYWGNAAYLSGLNWADTVSKIPYYSYGYSLLLVPLFWIFDNPIYMYKAAIILNGVMLSSSFLLCYSISKKLMKVVNRYILISISFLISMYPSYIVYSHIAWSESLLMFVCWLLTWCFTGINEKTKNYKFFLVGFLSGYIYIIHQRTIGILIASTIAILMMRIFKKINTKQLLNAILPIILLMIISFYLKHDIQSNLWLNGRMLSINDYSGQIKKINQMLSIDGAIKFFKVFIGQSFYLGAASYLIFYLGLSELIRKIGNAMVRSIKNKTINIIDSDDNFWVYLFLMIALLSTMTISAIFFINPILINEIIFGRYNEIILGPILLIGFSRLLKKRDISTKLFVSILLGFCILTVITSMIINRAELPGYQTIDIEGLVLMHSPFGIFIPAFIGTLACRLIWITTTKMSKEKLVITIIFISFIFIATGEVQARSYASENKERLKALKVVNIITSAKEDLPVYFLCDNPNSYVGVRWNTLMIRDRSVADCYQFLLKDKNIKQVSAEELSKMPGDKFVITTENIDYHSLMRNYKLCGNDEGSLLFLSNTSDAYVDLVK